MIISYVSVVVLLAQIANTSTDRQPLAVVLLHNPTSWDGPALVEIPMGRIGSAGSIDWCHVHLECEGRNLPFAIREGRAHWKARLTAPVSETRPEDLLVFSCSAPSGKWTRVEVMPGAPEAGAAAIEEQDGRVVVSYANVRVVVDAATGMLQECAAYGEPLLAGPFSVTPFKMAEAGYEMKGPFAAGYSTASVDVHKAASVPFKTKLVSRSTTPAMTELNFLLEPEEGPAMALTYRVHSMGLLEISVDERPWTGETPWLRHAVEYRLPLRGAEEALPLLENRWPFYGFRDYTAVVKNPARLHFGESGGVLELGEESVNGRRYLRRLYMFPGDRKSQAPELVELADEGLAIDITPARTGALDHGVILTGSGDEAAMALRVLSGALSEARVDTTQGLPVRLIISRNGEARDLEGDGFSIAADTSGGVTVRSCTRLGLHNATQTVARHLRRHGRDGGIPLIARNPVVGLRGGGFGGGDFEVDFPYGSDDEWRQAFDGLLDSGMNVFACLGMWGNWKMPVSYKYMPELRSAAPDAYDESSGAKFAELDVHREHGLKLTGYLRERGAQVWLWIPIGCVPTTFAKCFPAAMSPGSDKIPCFTHPEYRRYIDAFFREIIETYPIDGLALIRDDNGGICTCERCKEFVARSRTRNPVWEQYLVTYDWLRTHGFSGAIAVYPYNDVYEPRLDPLLPDDLYVMGHGGGAAVLVRNYERTGPMGDTWLDNLYANFRIPPSPRMRRLLSDRGSFWIGGAYCGTELPWESIGYFGWEPTATPNSLRYDWGLREFGKDGALAFLHMNNAYEHLWDINALYMPPGDWMKLSPDQRKRVMGEGIETVARFKAGLAELKGTANPESHARWFGHVDLFAPYFEYHLNRLDRFAGIYEKVVANREALNRPEGLPKDVREAVLADYAAMYDWASKYDVAFGAAMQKAPNGMLSRCRWMTKPYKEWMAGYDQWLDPLLQIHQFAGAAQVTTDPLRPGEPFTLRIELHNEGVCPWIAGAGHRIEFSGAAQQLGLPATWEFEGDPVAPGDRRTLTFQGAAPKEPGEGDVPVAFLSPFRVPEKFIPCTAKLAWK